MEDFNNELCRPYLLKGSGSKAGHGVLVIHGFTGSPAQLRPMADAINARGYTVRGILLPGHCTTLKDMARVSWNEYLDCVRQSYLDMSREYDSVSVAGLSMGGLLSLILSSENPVKVCVTLSAAVVQRNKLAPFAHILKYVMPPVMRWPEKAMHRDENFLKEYDYGYKGMPLRRVADLMKLSSLAQRALAKVTCPLLVVQSWQDETVDPVSAEIIMRGAASERKRLLKLAHSGHIVTLGPERERVWSAVCDWLDAVLV